MGRLLEIAEAVMVAGQRTNRPAITVDELPPDWRLEFEERAAIREYDSGQPREYAEAEALREIVARMRAAGVIPKKNTESA